MDKMNKFHRKPNATKSSGFTIVEVLIATTVFSLILVMSIFVIFSFTHHYYKAVNSSTTQNSARTVLNAVTQAIEFSGGQNVASSSSGNVNTYCIGSTQFDYVLYNLGSSSQDTMWKTPASVGGGCTTLSSPSPGLGSTQLLGSNIRVLSFQVCILGGDCNLSDASGQTTYVVNLTVAYGPGSTLCDINANPACPQTGSNTFSSTDATNGPSSVFRCVQKSGMQFCDVVNLSATVQMRT